MHEHEACVARIRDLEAESSRKSGLIKDLTTALENRNRSAEKAEAALAAHLVTCAFTTDALVEIVAEDGWPEMTFADEAEAFKRAAGRESGEPERLNAECPDLPGHETHTPPCGTFSRLYDAAAAKPAVLCYCGREAGHGV
jgi:hypothetical protein